MTDLHPCHDCAAKPGEEHSDGCDTARCLVTGRQRISCDVLTSVFGYPERSPHDDCGSQAWSGEWPGTAECSEYGLHTFWEHPGRGWVRCGPDHPKAGPNLNRLVGEAEWDARACRWRMPGTPVDDTFYVHWHLERGLFLEPSARYTVDGVTLPAADLLARISRRQP
jgi:hypothetical protein